MAISFVSGALVLAAGLGFGQLAEPGGALAPGIIAVDQGEVSDPVSEAPEPLMKVDVDPGQRCAAIAVDSDGVAEGNGRGPTLEAARESALADCRGTENKECRITSAACDPNEP
ncbi:MAG: DUF4189 domain-containing protein [Pseudomonadota bacterium]